MALALAGTVLVPAGGTAAAAEADGFYTSLAQLLDEQDDSFYFDSMELTIGSNILTVDGEAQQMDVAPDTLNQRTMLPIRAVAEAVGAKVDYDAVNQAVIIVGPYGDEIQCPIGSSSMSVNAELCSLDAPSYAKNGRTYLPVRAVAEALNLDVAWDQETSTVTISAPYQTARVLAWSDTLDAASLDPEKAIQDGSGLWVLQFSTPLVCCLDDF